MQTPRCQQADRNLNPYTRNHSQSLDDLHSVNNISQHNVELIKSTAAAADDIDAEKDADDDGFLKKKKRSSRMHSNGVEREKLPAYLNVSLTVSFSIMIQRYEWKFLHHHSHQCTIIRSGIMRAADTAASLSQNIGKIQLKQLKSTKLIECRQCTRIAVSLPPTLSNSCSLRLPLTHMLSNCQRTHHQVMIFIRAILLRYVFSVGAVISRPATFDYSSTLRLALN